MQLKWRLSHIRGYLELGLLRDAAIELQQIPPEAAGDDEVLGVQALFLQETREWPHLARVAAELVSRHPEEPAWWVTLAYATRRAETLPAAREILLRAEKLHPQEAVIHFNLGCYACQLGDLDEARRRVERAKSLDAQFGIAAQTDPDLAPLRASQA